MRFVAALSLLTLGCFARVPVEDGRPVFLNIVNADARDAHIVGLVPVGAAYWEACGARFTDDRMAATHVVDIEIVDSLRADHLGEWYDDGLWNRIRLSREKLWNFEDAALASVVAHEFGHVIGLEHLPDVDTVMHAPLDRAFDELGVGDRVAFRALTGRACLAPPPTEQIDRSEPRGSSF